MASEHHPPPPTRVRNLYAVDGAPTDRLPPQDIEAEQAVLGGMLLSADAIGEVVNVLDPGDYYRPAHETIHRAIRDLHHAGQPVDPIILTAELSKRGDLTRIGGPAYVHGLVNAVPTAANAEYYAEIVRNKARLRRLVEHGTRLVEWASAPGADPEEVGTVAVTQVRELAAPEHSALDSNRAEESPSGAVPNPLYDPAPDLRRPNRPGPTPHPAVFCGWLGETVRELDPTTEADPVAVLVNLMSAAGAIIGRRPHLWIGNDRHPALLWALTVGATSAGRKGSATSTAKRPLATAFPEFFGPDHTPRGLNSGEGLIEYVKDDDSDNASRASLDKRLWVVESEYAVTMSRGRREGSSLPGVLRQAWDGEDLGSMVRNSMKATNPHIAILGHITPDEFRAKMQDSEMAGGTYNRFLPIFCHRNLILPESRGADPQLINNLAHAWRTVLNDAAKVDEVKISAEARALYRDEIYPALTEDSASGALAEFTARAAPYTLRAAMVYALCDQVDTIQEEHMNAAWHLINYAHATAAHLVGSGSGDPKLDKLAAAVRKAGAEGLTGNDIHRLFKNDRKAERERLMTALLEQPGYTRRQRASGGRPTTVLAYAG
ncbi:DnaB-like helicase N-terminal domain-containing protein [Streptomyces bluensis]|uniref:DnaB-like helicase N-terminal domain-containing protein n=1 Tax=Streptomyces bluensis TaxID=33897 RepID=A0ABW6UL72_9ACTN